MSDSFPRWHLHRVRCLLAMGALSIVPGALVAQGIRDGINVERRNNCRLAAQVLEKGPPHPKYEWALSYIGACPDVAGPGLATRWKTPAADTAEYEALVESSGEVRDQRILEATLEVAGDEAQATLARLSALRVLTSYADSSAWVRLADLYPMTSGVILLPHRSDFFPRAGAVPLRADSRDRVTALLARLGDSSDAAVRRAAAYLAEGFRWRRKQLDAP